MKDQRLFPSQDAAGIHPPPLSLRHMTYTLQVFAGERFHHLVHWAKNIAPLQRRQACKEPVLPKYQKAEMSAGKNLLPPTVIGSCVF